MKYFVALFLFTCTVSVTFSVDTAAVKYYPLALGNVWTYSHFATNGPSYRYQEKITGTLSINGHYYYIFTTYRVGYSPADSYRRVDSLKNIILTYSTSSGCTWLINEITGDSLSAKTGDSSRYNCSYFYRADTLTKTLFGNPRKTKRYSWSDYFEAGTTRELTRDIGFTYESSFGHTNQSSNILIGCLINGTMYGDTSLVGINIISTEVPEVFTLYQNYPNPFNPVTHFEFRIAEFGFVRLTVFDVLGKEVQILVNKEMQQGSYETEWDASAYPSGVYYYKLEAGAFSETKKMVLIK